MTAPNVQAILRAGGYLYSGSDALGNTHTVECRVIVRTKAIYAEEWGQQEVGRLYCGETWILAAALRDFNATAIARLFPNASGGNATWNVSSGTRPGTLIEPAAVSFVPRSSAGKTITFPAAVGLPDASARFKLSLKDDLCFPMVFMAQPDSNGSVYVMS